MDETQKINLPNFVKIKSISKGKEDGEWVVYDARFNPYHITSYLEGYIQNYSGISVKPVVYFVVAGLHYCVDMTMQEADEMIENIDRSLSIKGD